MADPKTTLESLIEDNGGVLVRQKKHKVYRFPNGTTFVVASTPECPLAYDNALSHLKRILGVYPPDRGAPGTRRNKRLKQKTTTSSNLLPLEKAGRVEPWEDKVMGVAIQLTPATPKHHLQVSRKPLSFEQRMLRAGVRKLDRDV